MQDLENKKYRLVEEKELLVLLDSYHKLIALECGGVDNWGYYGEALGEYLEEIIPQDYPQLLSDDKDFDIEDLYFDDLAKEDLKDYPVFKTNN